MANSYSWRGNTIVVILNPLEIIVKINKKYWEFICLKNILSLIQDDCCASYKGVINEQRPTNSPSNLKLGPYPHTIIRHGTNKDADEHDFHFDCTNTVSLPYLCYLDWQFYEIIFIMLINFLAHFHLIGSRAIVSRRTSYIQWWIRGRCCGLRMQWRQMQWWFSKRPI